MRGLWLSGTLATNVNSTCCKAVSMRRRQYVRGTGSVVPESSGAECADSRPCDRQAGQSRRPGSVERVWGCIGFLRGEFALPMWFHQSVAFRSRKNPPLGPFSGKVASQIAVSAPSSGERLAASPPMRVRTQPGHMLLALTFCGRFLERESVRAFNAALLTEYAAGPVRPSANEPQPEETFTMRP